MRFQSIRAATKYLAKHKTSVTISPPEDVAQVVIRALKPFKDMIQTIPLDNGKELHRHKTFAKTLGVETYFCRPYHSWEKGLGKIPTD